MKKGASSKITAAISIFLLISSAVVPALADPLTLGEVGYVDGDSNIAIGNGTKAFNAGDTVIGSSYGTTEGAFSHGYTDTIIGSGADASGNGVAIGTGTSANAGASGGQTAVGSNAQATGSDNVAFGYKSGGTNSEDTCIGYKATEYNAAGAGSGTVIGAGATVNGALGTAVGYNATAKSYSAAFGEGATASGTYSTALGAQAVAKSANSVALGDNSVADRANSVSVGSAGQERQILNVAEGTAATDAANVGQVHKLGAMTAAIAGLTPLPYNGKERLQILANSGDYAGRQAVAVGVGYYDASKSLMMTTGMAFSGSETMARLGIAWKPGRSGGKEEMLADCSDTRDTMRLQDAQIKQMQDELNQQQEQAKQQEAQTKEKQAQLKELQDQVNKLLQRRVW